MDEFEALIEQKRFTEARRVAAKGIRQAIAKDGPNSLEVARHLVRIAFVSEDLAQYDRAEKPYYRALAVRENILGSEHPVLVTNLVNLGRLLTKRRKPDEAAGLLERAIAVYAHTDEPDSEFLLSAIRSLLDALAADAQDKRDHGQVAETVASTLDTYLNRAFRDATTRATMLHNTGEMCRQRGEHGDARYFLEKALRIREQSLGAHDAATLTTVGVMAAVCNDQQKYGEAEPLLQRILDATQVRGVHPGVRCMALNNVGFLHERRGNSGIALTLYQEALALALQEYGRWHLITRHLGSEVVRLQGAQQAWLSSFVYKPAIVAVGTWFASLYVVILLWGGGTEMWPAYAAALPAGVAVMCAWARAWVRGRASGLDTTHYKNANSSPEAFR